MPTATTQGVDQKLFLFDEMEGAHAILTSAGGASYYIRAFEESELNGLTVRTIEEDITTTDLVDDIFTMPDTDVLKLRLNDKGGERVPLFKDGVRTGTIEVLEIISTTEVRFKQVGVSNPTIESGDVLRLERDDFIIQDSAEVLDTAIDRFVLINSETGTSLVKQQVGGGAGLKKKF